MFSLFNKLLDYIYRKKCYFCHTSRENEIFCSSCREKIEYLDFKPVRKIENVEIFACCDYAKEIQKLIRAVKYHDKKELAYYQAKIMWEYIYNLNILEDEFVIIPTPLHKKRQKKRRFNHMQLVGNYLSEFSKWEINNKIIYRIKDTKPQYKLKLKEREENLKDAFKIEENNYCGKNILLIDDIFTTGSTFAEMIKELKKLNPPKIIAIATSSVIGSSIYQN